MHHKYSVYLYVLDYPWPLQGLQLLDADTTQVTRLFLAENVFNVFLCNDQGYSRTIVVAASLRPSARPSYRSSVRPSKCYFLLQITKL